MIHLSEKAAEQIKKLSQENGAEGKPLRLFIEAGGCSGFEYGMGFDDQQEGDSMMETSGVKVVIDPNSLVYLNGIQIDFNDGLNGRGFEITNPNAKSNCGCGKSFQ